MRRVPFVEEWAGTVWLPWRGGPARPRRTAVGDDGTSMSGSDPREAEDRLPGRVRRDQQEEVSMAKKSRKKKARKKSAANHGKRPNS